MAEPDTARMKAILLVAATAAFVGSPFFSDGFAGFSADQYPIPQDNPPVQPAGYAFSIWGLIYLWLLAHAAYGLLRRSDDPDWDRPRWALALSTGIGASWIPVANLSAPWATVLIWAMLLGALVALFRSGDARDRWLLQAPVAIYAGWLTAASLVAIGLIGAGYGVGPGSRGWAWIIVIAAPLIAGAIQVRLNRAPEYGLTVAWALVAVALRNAGMDLGLTLAAAAGAAIMIHLALRTLRR